MIYVANDDGISTVFNTDTNEVTFSTSGLSTTIDVINPYAHSIILIGGALGYAQVECT